MTIERLKPVETIERVLISSTSRFIAEYEAAVVVITHVWPGFSTPGGFLRMEEGPLSRNAYMLSFVVPEVPRLAGQMIPNYEETGDMVCSLLSLLFGKRFDSHGSVESHGDFRLPRLEQFNSLCIPTLPQNNHSPRSDIVVPLDLRQVARIWPLLTPEPPYPARVAALKGAAKFYHQALQNAERDAEVAYLHLITAGEVLTNTHMPESPEYLDEDLRRLLEEVKVKVTNGDAAAKTLANRIRQIKRRFCLTIEDLIDDQFFGGATAKPDRLIFKKEDFAKRISAAYDIRSRYVHTGVSFGGWIAPRRSDETEEVRYGRPPLDDVDFAKTLQWAPTYVGLERVIRYCLLKFAERHKLFVEAKT
jgi:hypothetical protein